MAARVFIRAVWMEINTVKKRSDERCLNATPGGVYSKERAFQNFGNGQERQKFGTTSTVPKF